MTDIRKWINLIESTRQERRFYINQANEFRKERDKWWPVSPELMASYKDGSQTREDHYGTLLWWKNDEWHRDGDKPARIFADDELQWWTNGLLHRDDDKPAVIDPDGSLGWYKNRKRHRKGDLPACIDPYGTLEWWKNGDRHRVQGPAVIDKNNKFQWWYKGKQIPVNSQDEYEEWLFANHPFDQEVKRLY